MNYLVVAFYHFVDPQFSEEQTLSLQADFKVKMLELGIRGTILVAQEGVNSTIVGEESAMRSFISYLTSLPGLENTKFKESRVDHIPFKRTLVRLKKSLIPFGKDGEIELNPARSTGKYIEPVKLKEWLDQKDPNVVLVDTRNDYEIKKGTFKGAKDWGLRHFRDFPEQFLQHKKELEGKKVVMFCTGGIRCEKATAFAQDQGIDVYQIEGGILQYFEDVGGAHYDGDCFVFDHRIAVNPKLEPVAYETAFPDGRSIEELDSY